MQLSTSKVIDKVIDFRNRHKFSAPTVFIGLGLLLFPLWGAFTGYPSISAIFAYGFIIVACLYSLLYFRDQVKLGTQYLYIPLFVLAFLALLRFAVGQEPITDKVLLASYFIVMIMLYFTAKQKGETLLWFVVPAIILYGLNVIVDGLMHLGVRAHGLSANCDTIAAMLMFCIFMLRGRWLWLAPLGFIAILFTGSYWAMSGLVIGGIVYLVMKRKELKWNSRVVKILFVCLLILCISAGLAFGTGMGQKLLEFNRLEGLTQNVHSASDLLRNIDVASYGRLTFYKYAFVDKFAWLGNGLNNVDNTEKVAGIGHMLIHNVPSMVMFELGVFGLLAWLATIVYGIWKSKKYRYVLIAVLALSLYGGSEFWTWYTFGSYYFLTLGLVGNEIEQESE